MTKLARPALFFLFLSLLSPLAFADDGEGSEDLGSYVQGTTDYVSQQAGDFAEASGAAAGSVPSAFNAFSSAFGGGSCDDMSSTGGTGMIVGLWLAPAVFTGFIVVLGVIIVYMLGNLLNSPSLIALAKDEGFQTAMTFLRVSFIIGILVAGQAWYGFSRPSTDPIYSRNPLMIDASMAFARTMVADMATHYSMLILYNTVIHTIYSATMWFGVTWRAMYSFNLGPVLKPLIDLIGTTLQFLSLGMSEWLLHIVTLCIIKKWMWSLFIPAGMLLRALPYTRMAGEALLALSFALVIFYPFMFLVDYEVHKLMKNNLVDAKGAMDSFIQKSGILNVFGSVLVIMFLMAGVFMPFFLGSALAVAFELIKGAVYYVVVMSVMLPFINIFVTLTAAKETAKFFNVDVNFMSFLKII